VLLEEINGPKAQLSAHIADLRCEQFEDAVSDTTDQGAAKRSRASADTPSKHSGHCTAYRASGHAGTCTFPSECCAGDKIYFM